MSTDAQFIRWYALAVGRYDEEVRATGTLSLTEWIEPPVAAGIAAGAVGGLNDAAYKADMSGGMPFGDGMRVAIVLEYPPPINARNEPSE